MRDIGYELAHARSVQLALTIAVESRVDADVADQPDLLAQSRVHVHVARFSVVEKLHRFMCDNPLTIA